MEPTESHLPSPERELSAGERFSEDLDKINSVIINLLNSKDANESDLREAWTVREILAESFIDSFEQTKGDPDPRPRIQFDVMVDKAVLFETVGNTIRYLEELDTAEAFALNNHLDDMVESIGEELDLKISELGTSTPELILKLRGTIEFSNRDYLRELVADGIDNDDVTGTMYGMILEDGGHPDEVLTRLGIIE